MEKNDIYELSRLINNSDGLQNDMLEVMETLRNTMQKKYINKIHAAADARQSAVVEHPPREVTLLRALKAFTPEESRGQLDNIIQALFFMNTVRNINESVSTLSQQPAQLLQTMSAGENEDAFNEDGVLPENAHVTGLLLTLALANVI